MVNRCSESKSIRYTDKQRLQNNVEDYFDKIEFLLIRVHNVVQLFIKVL